MQQHVIALAGGVGGAKLAHGLAMLLPPEALTVVVNVGDDFSHLGFPVCPDLDTVLYTLAGIANAETGWGITGESWNFMAAMQALGGETWFRLGDKDIATHTRRRQLLAEGQTLAQAIDALRRAHGIGCAILPASNDALRTRVLTEQGELDFQIYFVREQCRPVVRGLRYEGAEAAQPAKMQGRAWTETDCAGIVICPSNPYLSIAPILAMPAARRWLSERKCPAIAVSPIIGGAAVKGPAAKLMREFGIEPSALAVAEYYRGLIDYLLIDQTDADQAEAIAALGIRPVLADILMRDAADRRRLGQLCLDILGRHGAMVS